MEIDIENIRKEIENLKFRIHTHGKEFEKKDVDKIMEDEIVKILNNGKITLKKLLLLEVIGENINVYNMVVENKILEIQALILDLVDKEYTGELKIIIVEKWMKKLVVDLKIFTVNKKLLKMLIEKILVYLERVFLGKKKFGSEGNLLIADILYFENFSKKYVQVDFKNVIEKFYQNIVEKDKINIDVIRKKIEK